MGNQREFFEQDPEKLIQSAHLTLIGIVSNFNQIELYENSFHYSSGMVATPIKDGAGIERAIEYISEKINRQLGVSLATITEGQKIRICINYWRMSDYEDPWPRGENWKVVWHSFYVTKQIVNKQGLMDLILMSPLKFSEWRSAPENINSRIDLSQLRLPLASLRGIDFSNVNLTNCYLELAELSEANFSNSDLSNATLRGAYLVGADLSEATLVESNLYRANLKNADLRKANLTGADLSRADLEGADFGLANLTGAKLNGSILVKTNLEGANLAGCSVHGISVWNVNLKNTTQTNLVITDSFETKITVDNLAMAQFIYVLLNNQNIRLVIDTMASKLVLILGRFTTERKQVLEVLRSRLRERDYLPVLFDFEKPVSRDLTETISSLAHLARFVIADITEAKSIPQELQRIVPHLPHVPVQPIILKSQKEYALFEHFRHYPWVLKTFHYEDTDHLLWSISDMVIDPAEQWLKDK